MVVVTAAADDTYRSERTSPRDGDGIFSRLFAGFRFELASVPTPNNAQALRNTSPATFELAREFRLSLIVSWDTGLISVLSCWASRSSPPIGESTTWR